MPRLNLHAPITRRLNKNSLDRGSALVMAAIVSVVVFALAAILLSFANRQSTASNNDGRRQQAIDAAMAGLVVAKSALAKDVAYDSGLVTFTGGSAQYRVTSPASGNTRTLTSIGYAPSSTASRMVKRSVEQVVQSDPVAGDFTFGVFVSGSLNVNATVTGNVYAGKADRDQHLHGGIFNGNIFSPGKVIIDSGEVNGDIFSDKDMTLNGASKVNGAVHSGGTISFGSGTISNGAWAKFSINNCGLGQPCYPNSPYTPVDPAIAYPQFDLATFQAAAESISTSDLRTKSSSVGGLHGLFYVNDNTNYGSGEVLKLGGDTTIVYKENVKLPSVVNLNPGVVLHFTVIGMSELGCDSGTRTIPPEVKTLLYTKSSNIILGCVLTLTGAVYSAGEFNTNSSGSSITFAPGLSAIGFPAGSGGTSSSGTPHIVSTREI